MVRSACLYCSTEIVRYYLRTFSQLFGPASHQGNPRRFLQPTCCDRPRSAKEDNDPRQRCECRRGNDRHRGHAADGAAADSARAIGATGVAHVLWEARTTLMLRAATATGTSMPAAEGTQGALTATDEHDDRFDAATNVVMKLPSDIFG